jgi:glycerophosphoryl diester phosphodiesterase
MSFNNPVVLIGHRGAAGLEPENTLPSFRRAYDLGVDAVELDVYGVDGKLVVIHDDTVDRTTNGRGRVMEIGMAALRQLDAGQGSQIPLLEEVVAELPDGVGLNVELKGPGTAAPTAAFLAAHPGLDVLVSSFDHRELDAFRHLAPGIRVAPLFHRWRSDAWQTAEALGAWAINLSRKVAIPDRLAEAGRRGLKSFVYTVNDAAGATRLVDQGATGVFTDFPDRVKLAVPAGRVRA